MLRAGRAGDKKAGKERADVDFGQLVRDCTEATRARYHLAPELVRYEEVSHQRERGARAGQRRKIYAQRFRTFSTTRLSIPAKRLMCGCAWRRLMQNDRAARAGSGSGNPADDMKRIFRRFYRVDPRSLAHVKGTGLGLFIVKAIAQETRRKVFAQSEGEGQGTTVVIELPRSASSRRAA